MITIGANHVSYARNHGLTSVLMNKMGCAADARGWPKMANTHLERAIQWCPLRFQIVLLD